MRTIVQRLVWCQPLTSLTVIGNALRIARDKAGLSQEELGLRAGVDRSYISEIERDIKSPTIKMFVNLCRELGVQPSELISSLDD